VLSSIPHSASISRYADSNNLLSTDGILNTGTAERVNLDGWMGTRQANGEAREARAEEIDGQSGETGDKEDLTPVEEGVKAGCAVPYGCELAKG
jgi:hypothetical protein